MKFELLKELIGSTALPKKKVVSPFLQKFVDAEMRSYSGFLLKTILVTDSYICLLFIAAAIAIKKSNTSTCLHFLTAVKIKIQLFLLARQCSLLSVFTW